MGAVVQILLKIIPWLCAWLIAEDIEAVADDVTAGGTQAPSATGLGLGLGSGVALVVVLVVALAVFSGKLGARAAK